MNKSKKGDGNKRKRKLKLLRLAAAGGLVAWVLKKRKASPPPEGVWRDYTKRS